MKKERASNLLQPLKSFVADGGKVGYQTGPVYYYTAAAGTVLAGHSHAYPETLWVVEGSGRITIDLLAERFYAPCVINIPSNAWHKLIPEGDVKFIEQRHAEGNT